jgi:hypothetical protein
MKPFQFRQESSGYGRFLEDFGLTDGSGRVVAGGLGCFLKKLSKVSSLKSDAYGMVGGGWHSARCTRSCSKVNLLPRVSCAAAWERATWWHGSCTPAELRVVGHGNHVMPVHSKLLIEWRSSTGELIQPLYVYEEGDPSTQTLSEVVCSLFNDSHQLRRVCHSSRADRGFESHLRHGCLLCVCVYSVFVLSCVQVAALRRADHSSKESYRLWKNDYGTE